jgi:hypothetical protein
MTVGSKFKGSCSLALRDTRNTGGAQTGADGMPLIVGDTGDQPIRH